MPLQTHRNKEDKKMYKVLLETGELKEFRTLKAAIRKSVVINGKKQILYISENVGFGPDTNTLIFDNEYEYGNLTSARIKYLMNKLAFNHILDLSYVHIVNGLNNNKVINDEEYVIDVNAFKSFVKPHCREQVFLLGGNLPETNFYSSDFFGVVEYFDDNEPEASNIFIGDFIGDVYDDDNVCGPDESEYDDLISGCEEDEFWTEDEDSYQNEGFDLIDESELII